MPRPALPFLLCVLFSFSQAQFLASGPEESPDDEKAMLELSLFDGVSLADRTGFLDLISDKPDRDRDFYSYQRNLMLNGDLKSSRIIVKLARSEEEEDEEEEDGSFFDPFFRWSSDLRQQKFKRLQELKSRGEEKMREKMKLWNLNGESQLFFGYETGVSILDMSNSTADLFSTWAMTLADPDVEFAELDMGVRLFQGCGSNTDWGSRYIRADDAVQLLGLDAEENATDAEVLVAVIDSGVDYEHPFIRGRLWINEAELNGEDGVDDDLNGYVDDIYGWNFGENNADVMDTNGHGTHVAGIIAAEASLDPLFSGAAPNVRILPCRFTDAADSGSVSAAIRCMEYAFEMGADILSNSWGGAGAASLALEAAMNRASRRGNLQINAAGNDGNDNDGSAETATYPAAFETDIIIAVAAVNDNGSLSGSSNFGNKSTDIGAPGVEIFSTDVDGKFGIMSGTSQATPFVTAAAAILLGACRQRQMECTALDVKDALIRGAESSPNLEGRVVSAGFVDIPRAAHELNLLPANASERVELATACSRAEASHPKFYLIYVVILCFVCFAV